MLSKIKKSNSEGFTIIEVMIVLAVAALILLIVLLAVPALQRTSRNTALKNDASSVSAAISTSISDNNGTIPSSVTNFTNPGWSTSVSVVNSGATEKISVQGSTDVANITESTPCTLATSGASCAVGTSAFTASGGTGTASGLTVGAQQVLVVFGAACWGSTTTATANTVATVFGIETSGGLTLQCLQSS